MLLGIVNRCVMLLNYIFDFASRKHSIVSATGSVI
jgi:hypothetical protein